MDEWLKTRRVENRPPVWVYTWIELDELMRNRVEDQGTLRLARSALTSPLLCKPQRWLHPTPFAQAICDIRNAATDGGADAYTWNNRAEPSRYLRCRYEVTPGRDNYTGKTEFVLRASRRPTEPSRRASDISMVIDQARFLAATRTEEMRTLRIDPDYVFGFREPDPSVDLAWEDGTPALAVANWGDPVRCWLEF